MGAELGKPKKRGQVKKHRIFNNGTANPNHTGKEGTDKANKKHYDNKIERYFH